MPTVPRRPAAQEERDRLQARRLRAAELFAAGVTQAESPTSSKSRLRPSVSGMPAGRRAAPTRCAAAGRVARRRGCRMPSSPRSSRPCWTAPPPMGSSESCGRWTASPWSSSASPASSIIRSGCGRCCAIGWAGACSARSVAPPSVTRTPSTTGSRSAGRRIKQTPNDAEPNGTLRCGSWGRLSARSRRVGEHSQSLDAG